MLTIQLTAEDLGRVRFATAPAPILEMVLMLFELKQQRPANGDEAWRRLVRTTFPTEARPLLQLVPSRRSAVYLDVLTEDPDEGFDLVRHMPRDTLDTDLARMSELNIGPIPAWLRQFASGDDEVRAAFDRGLRAFHESCLVPQWAAATSRFYDDIAQRTVTLSQHGVAPMLNALTPELRLTGLTLTGHYPWDRHVLMEGQGLVLVPSAFWTGHPLFTWDPHQPSRHVLIYPAAGAAEPPGSSDALDALLGATRAAALRTLHRPRTTSGLAQALRVSVASASKHATTLRRAGLITTSRHGPAVEHRLTDLGLSLLRGRS